jgi:hypothetical protein
LSDILRDMPGFRHAAQSAAAGLKGATQMIRPARRNSHWSPEEDTRLCEFARSGVNATNIAENLGRSSGSVRIRAQRLNITLTRSGRLTTCRGWLKLTEARTSFLVLPDRANIVRKIFELSIAGLGGYTIAKQLNAKNVPAFGPSPKWDQSTIHNMLRNRATVGEHQPKRYRNGKEFPVGDPIPNYYPAIMIAAKIGDRELGVVLFQNPDDPLFRIASRFGPRLGPKRTSNSIKPERQGYRPHANHLSLRQTHAQLL